jgi:hypothetical protein
LDNWTALQILLSSLKALYDNAVDVCMTSDISSMSKRPICYQGIILLNTLVITLLPVEMANEKSQEMKS